MYPVPIPAGGWCYNQDDCYGRSSGNLGSSVNWPAEKSAGGVMSMDNSVNPATANWNHLYLAYCDVSVWRERGGGEEGQVMLVEC